MNRQKFSLLALSGVVVLMTGVSAAQAPTAAPAAGAQQTARPKLVAPVRGTAELGYTKPLVKNATIGGWSHTILCSAK